MKKFLSLVLVALFVFSLSVSAMAADNTYRFYDDVYLPITVDIDGTILDLRTLHNAGTFLYLFEYVNTNGIQMIITDTEPTYYIGTYNSVRLKWHGETHRLIYDEVTASWDWQGLLGTDANDSLARIRWANVDVYDMDGYLVLNGDTEFTGFCNGASCPATDFNYDGVCDDCGLTLMNLVRTPTGPEVTGNNKQFVMFYTGETYYYTVYTSNTAYSIRGYNYGTRMRTTTDITVNVQRFTSSDGLNWQSEYTGPSKDYYPGEQGWTLLSSTFNWYDSSENTSDPFFPVPLWAEVEKVTQGEIPGMTEQTMTTMGFLMACGIGCLALLMALALFGKRLLIYRG